MNRRRGRALAWAVVILSGLIMLALGLLLNLLDLTMPLAAWVVTVVLIGWAMGTIAAVVDRQAQE